MANEKMKEQMSTKGGFIAALDQSGGSTPGALRFTAFPTPNMPATTPRCSN